MIEKQSDANYFAQELLALFHVGLSDCVAVRRGDGVVCRHGLHQAARVLLDHALVHVVTGREIGRAGQCPVCGLVYYRANFWH